MGDSHSMPEEEALLQRALEALRVLRAREREAIAIVGMACTLPGAPDLEAYWNLLSDGGDGVGLVTPDRWDADDYPDTGEPGGFRARHAGLIDGIDRFDHEFFGISPREARSLDPQQRLVLTTAWQALEHAAIPGTSLKGSRTGVFVGATARDYAALLQELRAQEPIDAYYVSGNALNFIAGRLSYFLGLRGPAMAVDTACSSSLTAIHLATQALRRGECDAALVGGVNLVLAPEVMEASSRSNLLSANGRCKTFDATADGIVRGEGCGMLVLERLSVAQAKGRRILAVIAASALNQDGASSGLMAPNGSAQSELITEALRQARIEPGDIDYVEAHGTGTALGDPIELAALQRIATGRTAGSPLRVGSAKTNIGHLESAAGVAAVIKVVLALNHDWLPGNRHFTTLNPAAGTLPDIAVLRDGEPWARSADRVRRAGVSSFGGSGSNAHLIIAEAPAQPPEKTASNRPSHVVTISARSDDGLRRQAARWRDAVANTPSPLADLAYAANAGRSHFRHCAAIRAADRTELADALDAIANGRLTATPNVQSGVVPARRPRIAFLFAGQGAQRAGMGRELYAAFDVFRDAIDALGTPFGRAMGMTLPALLWGSETHRLDDTRYTQPALFCYEYALATLWRSWGIEPDFVMGHSVGEVVAATVAGVMSATDGLALIIARGSSMADLCQRGAMLAVRAGPDRIDLGSYADRLGFAAFNGPSNTVVSGETAAIEQLSAVLERNGINGVRLPVSHAFHSPMMTPMLGAFGEALADLSLSSPMIPVVSNVTGKVADAAIAQPEYWTGHVMAPVAFLQGVETLAREGATLALEIGPGTTLTGMVRVAGVALQAIASQRHGAGEVAMVQDALAQLYVAGASIDWSAIDGPCHTGVADLPTYAFADTRAWPLAARTRAANAEVCYRTEWEAVRSVTGSGGNTTRVVYGGGAAGVGVAELAGAVDRTTVPDDAAWDALLDSVGGRPLDVMIFADALGSDDEGNGEQAIVALLRLHRLLTDAAPGTRAWLVTGESIADAAIGAAVRCLMLERPDLWCATIVASDDGTALLAQEFDTVAGIDRILNVKDGDRRAARLRLMPVEDRSMPAIERPDDVRIVTGGLGAIGLELAAHLVRRGARRLVLLSRRGEADLPDRIAKTLAMLRQSADVITRSVDIADAEAVAACIDDLGGVDTVAGLYHAAGAIDVGEGGAIDPGTVHAMFAPKADGARVLDHLFHDVPMAEFVLLSSASAVWGSVNLAHYAAANAAMAAIAERRRARGLPALCVDLGPVTGEGGMATGAGAARVARAGLRSMSPATLFAKLDALVSQGADRVVIAEADWGRYATSFAAVRAEGIFAKLLPAAPPPIVSPATTPDAADIPMIVRDVLGAVLARDDVLPADLPIQELGIDSLMAVEVRDRLQQRLGRKLPATLIFDAPTIDALIDLLSARRSSSGAVAGTVRTDHRSPIAIVGIGARFPGGGETASDFWTALTSGADLVNDHPASRWPIDAYLDPTGKDQTKAYTLSLGLLDGIEGFDPAFFNINPREARLMDPQQRLVLEGAWRAMEAAAIAPGTLRGTRTSVFLGTADNEYLPLVRAVPALNADAAWLGTGNKTNVIPGRLSYLLGLEGPSVAVDTACSSSAVAIHLAVQSLRRGESDAAFAGGVNVILDPETFVAPCRAGMLSRTGRCRTFDHGADGYVRAEGCGVLLLKRLDDAVRDNDPIVAVIHGSATNQDGRSSSLTAPNGAAQERVIRAALADADASPADIEYVEAHGTGTSLGDPIEIATLSRIFGDDAERTPVRVGAVKSVMGHSEAAAGAAGVIKTALSLKAGSVPANLHFSSANPEFGETGMLQFVTGPQPLGTDAEGRVGVSAFGFSGTNAHLVLGPAPLPSPASDEAALGHWPVVLSARNEAALRDQLEQLDWALKDYSGSVAAISRGACLGREPMPVRIGFVATDKADLAASVAAALASPTAGSVTEERPVVEVESLFRAPNSEQACRRLVAAFVAGADVDWTTALADVPGPRLSLWRHKFDRQRFWPTASGPLVPGRTVTPTTGHYLLGDRIQTPRGRDVRFRRVFTPTSPAYVDDHRLLNTVVVPAASHVSMLLSAARIEFGQDACSATDIMLLAPMVIADDGAREVQLLLTPGKGGDFDVELVSADVDAVDQPSAWVVHMTARLSRTVTASPIPELGLEAYRHAGRPVLDAPSFYGHFWDHGYTLGPSFRWLHDGWTDGESVLRELRQPKLPDDPNAFQLYPGLIDTSFSVLGSGQADWLSDIDGERINIPFAIDRIDLLQVPKPGEALYALASPQDATAVGERPPEDIVLTDADGRPLARIVGFKVLKADRDALKTAHRRSSRGLAYRLSWRSAPIDVVRNAVPTGRILIGTGTAGTCSRAVAMALGELLADAGADDIQILDAGDAKDALDLPSSTTTYVDLTGLDDPADGVTGTVEAVTRTLALAQAATVAAGVGVVRVVSAASSGPTSAAVWALWRGVHAERPDIDAQAVDFAAPATDQEMAARLFSELTAPAPLTRSSWTGQHREVEWLKREKLAGTTSRPFTPDAPVLITGGTGGIGRALTQWLFEAGVDRVVIGARRQPDDAVRDELADLAGRYGKTVEIVVADASMANFDEQVRSAFGDGTAPSHVFHLAGVTDDRLIEQVDRAGLERVLAPKVAGTIRAEAVAAEHGAAFVAFSSMAAFLPASGQAVYAAANAFIDAYVRRRRDEGRDSRAIAWGPWREVGMAARLGKDFERAVRASGIEALEPTLAFDLLDQALGDDHDHLLIAAIDWAAFAQARPEWSGLGMIDSLVEPRADAGTVGSSGLDDQLLAALAAAAPAQRWQLILAFLRPLIVAAVGLPPGTPVVERQRFFEFGLDSLAATELRQTLQIALGLKLRATLVFDHPTLADLAAHLLELLFGEVSAARPVAKPSIRSDSDEERSSIEAMSDEEAHALLLKELE